MRRWTLLLVALAGLLIATMLPASAGGSAEKATGELSWTRGGSERSADFNAHEAADGRPAKGELHQWRAGQSFTVEVDRVEVEPAPGGGDACFAGTIVSATGSASSRVGNTRVTRRHTRKRRRCVRRPRSGDPRTDRTFEEECDELADFVDDGVNAVSGGNLIIHPAQRGAGA